jgi:hypothetical protein
LIQAFSIDQLLVNEHRKIVSWCLSGIVSEKIGTGAAAVLFRTGLPHINTVGIARQLM